MSHTCYALYNTTELNILSVSGSIFTDIPDGFSMCKVHEKDCEDFNTHKKIMHDYLVNVDETGYAKFKSKYLQLTSTRGVLDSNVIQDLNYQDRFFEFLNMRYIQENKIISITFDASLLDEDSQTLINTAILANNKYILYVTEHQDPTALITKVEIDLIELSKSKILNIPCNIDKHISLWGARLW